MLRAEDLMIGDWVKVPGYDERFVKGVSQSGVVINGSWFLQGYEKLEPIPITPEILEKNGFVEDRYERMILESCCFFLQKGVDGVNLWWWEVCNSPIVPINAVHELQHALKLCGIEKEIVL